MALPVVVLQDSDESKLYTVDFTSALATGETVSTATITGDPSGLTIGSPVVTSPYVQFRVSGGTSGSTYHITVSITTSLSNTVEECFNFVVQPCTWMQKATTMLRFMIGDTENPPTYSDTRLAQLLCLGAEYTQQELSFSTTYDINIATITISPDPVENGDTAFTNFMVLKAACFVDQAALRTRATAAGLKAVLGPLSLDTSSTAGAEAYLKVLENGPCKSFETLKTQFQYGNLAIVHAIMGPFISNGFDPSCVLSMGYYLNHDCRSNY